MKAISKSIKLELIKTFFASSGKRLTNISKLKDAQLDDICFKHNIPIQSLYEESILNQIKNMEQKTLDRRNAKKRLDFIDSMKSKWDELSNDEREMCINHYAHLITPDPESVQKENDAAKCITDAMEQKFIREGARIQRTGLNTLIVNGIHLTNGHIRKIPIMENVINRLREEDNHDEVYESSLIIPIICQLLIEKKHKIKIVCSKCRVHLTLQNRSTKKECNTCIHCSD